MSPPFDDGRTREDLLRENARLRDELLRKRTHSPMWPVMLGLVVHIALRPACDPWLNAASDTKVGAAVTVLVVPLVFSVVMLVRALRPTPD